jgi:hypothetical protein
MLFIIEAGFISYPESEMLLVNPKNRLLNLRCVMN